ncbi:MULTISPECIES: S24 family peptidase [unclassified Methylibium]|uniref:LexA family protein n=1 Tax=unclassified Methylibium TaxID=2633235 RepID=UPI0003F42A0B|nr:MULTISPECIES: S24 family peptidase [unclassified Methylibium]EWS54905.1 LexA repressor [Methylibium sp. T29]EWS61740.1 LexA repressor [Methylibium sp. T29-B]
MARPNNDQVHLRRLRDLYARERCLPSYENLAAALGFRAKNAAFSLVKRLAASGHVGKAPGGRLVPGPAFFALDFSDDSVMAGLDPDQEGSGFVHEQRLSELVVSRPSRTILISVRGESMVGVGILSGDVAVVETGVQAMHGDYVVAEVDDAHTVKEFRQAGAKLHLLSHGSDGDKAIVPTRSLNIVGVVRGIVRAYRPQARVPTKLAKEAEQ